MKYQLLLITALASRSIDKDVYLKSRNTDSIVIDCYELDEDDTAYVPFLLQNPYNPRESLSMKYHGFNIYRAKMDALMRISGLTPPAKINNDFDSSIVNFYQHWAGQKGYIK